MRRARKAPRLQAAPRHENWPALERHLGAHRVPRPLHRRAENDGPRYVLRSPLRYYFTAKPEHERTEAGATDALCEAPWSVLHDARLASQEAESAVIAAIRDRRAAIKALRKRCRSVVVKLWCPLSRDRSPLRVLRSENPRLPRENSRRGGRQRRAG